MAAGHFRPPRKARPLLGHAGGPYTEKSGARRDAFRAAYGFPSDIPRSESVPRWRPVAAGAFGRA